MATLGRCLLYFVLVLVTVVVLTPIFWLIFAAFKSTDDFQRYPLSPPVVSYSPAGTEAAVHVEQALRYLRPLRGRHSFAVDAQANQALGELVSTMEGMLASRWVREEGMIVQHRTLLENAPDADSDAEPGVVVREALLFVGDAAGLQQASDTLAAVRKSIADVRNSQDAEPVLAMAANELDRAIASHDPAGEREVGTRFTVSNFHSLFGQLDFMRYMMNSFFVTCATVLLQLFFSSLGGFALAKYEFRGKRGIMLIMLATMMIPGPVLLAPLYELIFHFGLIDTHMGLIVPGLVSVFGMFLFRQSMLSIPDDLLQAARMDGCSELGVYWNVALPVSRPMIGAFCLIAFMGTWNSFLWPQIILQTSEKYTLPIGLRHMVGLYQEDYGALMAGTLLAIVPVVILFFVLQREFIAGLTAGAVKG